MKRIVLTALIALVACSAFAFDSAIFTPNGKISSYTKTDYSISTKFGDTFRTPKTKFVHTFDATGLETETSEYTTKDVLIDKIAYQYDASRNLVSTTFYDANNALVWKTLMVYENGRVKEESEFDRDNNLTSKTIYKYDGTKADETYYDASGKLLSKTITIYNAQNKIAEENEYLDDGSLDQKTVYTYTDKGTISQVEVFETEVSSIGKTVYRYDDKGYITEVQKYNGSGTLYERDIYKNDAVGNPTRVSVYMVVDKFGGTQNELDSMSDYTYKYF